MIAGSNDTLDAGAGFATVDGGAGWSYSGALNYSNAGAVFAASARLPLPTAGKIDLRRVSAVDSAAVSVLLAVKRRALVERTPIEFTHTPVTLAALAELYGVEEILGA